MAIKYALQLSLYFFAASLYAQPFTWHKEVKESGYSVHYCRLLPVGERYLMSTIDRFMEFDRMGTITGNVVSTTLPGEQWTRVLKKHAAGTGHPYFIVLSRLGPALRNYALSEYRPGAGFPHKRIFTDSLGTSSQARPELVELNDSTFVVFGYREYRKIKYSPLTGFVEEWARPLERVVTTVLLHQNQFILADEKGQIWALDESGNTVWAVNHDFTFRTLKTVSDGYIGCGRTVDNAVMIKLAFDGSVIWKKEYPEKGFYDVITTADGGYAATGSSLASNMVLVKADVDGNQLWKQEYSAEYWSVGGSLLEAPDGGFVVAGISHFHTQILKTDAAGLVPEKTSIQDNYRQVKTQSVQADIYPGSTLFFDGVFGTLTSIKDSSAATMLTLSPWIGGLNTDKKLHIATNDFFRTEFSDYRPGMFNAPSTDFTRVWATDRKEIRRLREDFLLDQSVDSLVPFDLLTWPAKGNPHFQYNPDFSPVQTNPELFPAPFVDANGDGVYNVYEGDYPVIKGDRMAWLTFTDSVKHARSRGNPLLVDISVSVYAYDCEQNSTIDGSLFADVEAINRSQTLYEDTYMGFFADLDLGCYYDDHIGSLPDANAVYVYNADASDGPCNPGFPVFPSEIPVQSLSFLDKTLSSVIYYTGTGIQQPQGGVPYLVDLPRHFYNTLRGKWSEGAPVTRGGTGINKNSTDSLSYVFPDNPADTDGWSMCTVNNLNGDHFMIPSHGPFSFAPGDTFQIQIGLTLHPDIPHPCPDIFGLVKPAIAQLQQWHDTDALTLYPDLAPIYYLALGQTLTLNASVSNAAYNWSTGVNTPEIVVASPGEYAVTITSPNGCSRTETVSVRLGTGFGGAPDKANFTIWPNPASDQFTIQCDACSGALRVNIYNTHGQLIKTEKGNQIWLSDVIPGIYWVELFDGPNRVGGKKVIRRP